MTPDNRNYTERAQANRPTDATALAREATALASQGLRPADIASALGIPTQAATQMLQRKS
jgi:DNA-binding CsgD family transcriptional regulator